MRGLSFPPNLTRSSDRKPTKVAYALPTFFTAGNMFLGFVAVMKAFEGSMAFSANDLANPAAVASAHFSLSALLIGVAVLLDGLDGRIARLTNTTSDFGREMDSMADVITFGIAPAVLAFAWGIYFVDTTGKPFLREHVLRIGYFVAFLYLLCGSARLARFNVTANPVPKNPGRPDRKYFVGLPIPAAAGMLAAVVYASGAEPLRWWPAALIWVCLLAILSFLMLSTWRYRSFKDINLGRPRSFRLVVTVGVLIYLIVYYSQPVLLAIGLLYVGSGIAVRLGGSLKRRIASRNRA